MSKAKQKTPIRSVEISCIAPAAREVFVAGTFNGWDQAPMKNKPGGRWIAKLSMQPGEHEYKYIVDGEWCCKPGVSEFDPVLSSDEGYVGNAYGTKNCKLVVT